MGFVAYYRVSTRKQGDSGLGLESQKAILCNYLNCDDLVAEFTEVASGKNVDGRPQLQRAVKLCVDGGHTLAVAKLDRLSRKTEDALKIWGQLDGRLYSCDIPQENGKMDKFTLTIFMAIADRERELIGIRTKAALAATKARGTILGKPENLTEDARVMGALTNKRLAKRSYTLEADTIADKRAQGWSYRQIANHLNTMKDRTGNPLRTRQGKEFKPMTVKRILDRA